MNDAATCRGCDAPLNRVARYCKHCGTRRVDDTSALSASPETAAESFAGSQQPPPGSATYASTPPSSWPYSPSGEAPRAVPPPEYPPQASPDGKRARPWPAIAAAAAAFVLIASAILALVLASASGGGGVHAATVVTVTRASEPAPAISAPTGRENPAPPSSTATSSPAQPSGPTRLNMVAYHGASMSAEVPAGWTIQEDEAQKTGYSESKWTNPANSADYVLIDASPATHLTPEQDASPVHKTLQEASGYREISYKPGDLAGVNSWMWLFTISGDKRIDYFFEKCTSSFGVLGSTVPTRFSQLRPTFRGVAQSVQSTCR